ncbi:MAG: alkaline phosphatase D family protein [Pirellulaceae bacterium]|nr:alkaline phosphatase D family protein [Pirellulaceae bacterium]
MTKSPISRCGLSLICCLLTIPCLAQEITHGPILGRPASDSMSIWARTSKPASLQVRYGTSSDELDQISKRQPTKIEDDCTGVVTLKNLAPNTDYFYEIFAPDHDSSQRGSFRTFPDAKKRIDPQHNPKGLFNFSFEFACGNNQQPESGAGPSLPTYDTLNRQVKDKVDFAILNGDWLYEEQRDYPVNQWKTQTQQSPLPKIVEQAPSITGVWQNYKQYLDRAPNLAEWHRHVPSFFTYDDHEALNDIYGTGTAGFRDRRAVFRDIAVRAWFDYLAWSNPLRHKQPAYFGSATLTKDQDVLYDGAAKFQEMPLNQLANLHVHWGGQLAGVLDPEPDSSSADPNHGVYEIVEVIDQHRLRIQPAAVATGKSSYSIGRRTYGQFRIANCDFFFLDTRSHRDLHDVTRPNRPDVSMLGRQQMDWLIRAMGQSDADFQFVISSVNFMVPHVGAGGGDDLNLATAKDDAWTVFLHDREKLINFWDQLDAPVFVLTGDLHNSFAIKITDNVWEFASGPHNSVNHRPIEDEGGRPANGEFQYGPRKCDIRWSSYVLSDIPRKHRLFPHYCIVQVKNVFNNPPQQDGTRWVAFPRPFVIFQYFDGKTGALKYSETIHTRKEQ